MQKYRFLPAIVLLFICSICVSFSVSAAKDSDVVVSLQIDDPIMEVNGTEVKIDADRGTVPMITNGRTLVPIRAIIEAFDGSVSWDETTKTVQLTMNGDVIKLVINSTTAYFNNTAHILDVAPAIINGRTMLPVRFIAESFNLAVAWESDTQTITIIRNSFDSREYDYLMSVVPAYSGSPYAIINNGIPLFKDYEIIDASFEYYSCLDELGRCDVAMASVSKETMPTDERGDISSITPTGWKNTKYDIVSGGYLYNRCHLIGYQLTGENDNAKNLITGTGYMNISGMLPLENRIDYYIEYTGNHVMYRVTPVFIGNNLLADGVLMEAYSVEDDGLGISFCVYCYNVQPFICIDYTTGDNSLDTSSPYIQGLLTQQPVIKEDVMPELPPFPDNVITQRFFRTPTGKRYHLDPDCGGKNSYETTYEEAISSGLTPCQKCAVP